MACDGRGTQDNQTRGHRGESWTHSASVSTKGREIFREARRGSVRTDRNFEERKAGQRAGCVEAAEHEAAVNEIPGRAAVSWGFKSK
jgi:hypothetical protein